MIKAIHLLIAMLGAIRYLVSLLVVGGVVTYEVAARLGYMPSLAMLTTSPGAFIMLVTIGIAALLAALWLVSTLASASAISTGWQYIYRQTDAAGLRGLNVFVLLVVAGGMVLSQALIDDAATREVALTLALVCAAPLLVDMVPARRPRRLIAPQDGRTVHEMAERLHRKQRMSASPEALGGALLYANDQHLRQQAPHCQRQPDEPLPEGIALEIPPEVWLQ